MSTTRITLESVNVGQPREVAYRGEMVSTGIFKTPVAAPVMVRRLNIDGDKQADLTVHGGVDKAVYAYPVEHHTFWRALYPDLDIGHGTFGENLSILGATEEDIFIGDRLRIGHAELEVSQPRLPCFKFNIRLGKSDAVRQMVESKLTGFYFRVLKEGDIGAGDDVEFITRPPADRQITVRSIVQVYFDRNASRDQLLAAATVEALPAEWRDDFRRRADKTA